MFAFDFDELENKSPVQIKRDESSSEVRSQTKTAAGQKCKATSPPSGTTATRPSGNAPLTSHEQRIRQWHMTAECICQMLHEMRERDFVAGKGWMEGMQHLIEHTPRDHVGRRYGLDDFAGPLLRDHFIQWTAAHSRAVNFRKVILRLEMKVVVATKHLDLNYDWTLRQGAFGRETMKMAEALGATKSPPFDGFMHMKRGLLFVGLPLRLYLADSPHLYELLRRMRQSCGLAEPSVSSIRATLDANGLPYSVLVYGILAALQALHAARLTGTRAGTGAQGLDAFCATARRDGDGFEVKEVDQNCSLIFRGIWVPQRIDEYRATYTWTFNSFSRSVQGVMWVLDFYAVEPTGNEEVARLAWEESHILLYVARFHATSSVWAFPVQFFNSGIAADVEKELVVLPFVEYEFEKIQGTMYEIRSSMSSAMKRSALAQMESRWGVSFAEQAPLLLELLEGGASPGCKEYGGLNRKLKVSVRFVKAIKPCKPILKLMSLANSAPEELLLAFPPKDPEAAKDAKSIFGAGYAELNQMVDPGNLKPLGTFVPGQKIAAGL